MRSCSGVDPALQQRVVDDVGQGAVGDLVTVEAGADRAADALGVVGDVNEHLLGLDRVRLYVDVQADVLFLQPVHLANELLAFRLELGRPLRADLACHIAVDSVDVLQQAFRRRAVAGTGSGIDDWLQILADAELEVFSGIVAPRSRRPCERSMTWSPRARSATSASVTCRYGSRRRAR
jgi:hypothetical protein